MIRPQKSGHCSFPETAHPAHSHERCASMGAGNKARPSKEFQPCACACHYEGLPQYDCECGGVLVETLIENDDRKDVDEEGNLYPVYMHLARDGSILGQECP